MSLKEIYIPKTSRLKKIGYHYRRPSSKVTEYYATLYTARECKNPQKAEQIVREYIEKSGLAIAFARITKIEKINGVFFK